MVATTNRPPLRVQCYMHMCSALSWVLIILRLSRREAARQEALELLRRRQQNQPVDYKALLDPQRTLSLSYYHVPVSLLPLALLIAFRLLFLPFLLSIFAVPVSWCCLRHFAALLRLPYSWGRSLFQQSLSLCVAFASTSGFCAFPSSLLLSAVSISLRLAVLLLSRRLDGTLFFACLGVSVLPRFLSYLPSSHCSHLFLSVFS